jgi:hypothetical protein
MTMGRLEQALGLETPEGQPMQFGRPGTPTENSFISTLLNRLAQSRAAARQPPQQGPPLPPGLMPDLSGGGPQPQNPILQPRLPQQGPPQPPPTPADMSGMVPEILHRIWGLIPSAADIAVTGKPAATPEEFDRARNAKEKLLEAKRPGSYALPRERR